MMPVPLSPILRENWGENRKGGAAMRTLISVVLLFSTVGVVADQAVGGLPLHGEEAVAFLLSAEVVGEPALCVCGSKVVPPDLVAWYDQMDRVLLFQHLINDLDRANIRNIVSDPEFKIYKVDSSMSFYAQYSLREEGQPTRFSRQFLESLESLDQVVLDERLKAWATKNERKALWARRGLILELAAKQVAERGEAKVLY